MRIYALHLIESPADHLYRSNTRAENENLNVIAFLQSYFRPSWKGARSVCSEQVVRSCSLICPQVGRDQFGPLLQDGVKHAKV